MVSPSNNEALNHYLFEVANLEMRDMDNDIPKYTKRIRELNGKIEALRTEKLK